MVKRAAELPIVILRHEAGGIKRRALAPPTTGDAQQAWLGESPQAHNIASPSFLLAFGLPAANSRFGRGNAEGALLGQGYAPAPSLPPFGFEHAARTLSANPDAQHNSDDFWPRLESFATHHAAPLSLGSGNAPVIAGLERIASVLFAPQAGAGAVPQVLTSALYWAPEPRPTGARVVPLRNVRLQVDTFAGLPSLAGFTGFMHQLAEPPAAPEPAAALAKQPLPLSPFYEGEKHKGVTRRKREAFECALAEHNKNVAPGAQVVAEGPVALEKLSIFAGDGQSYVVTGRIIKGMAGKFRGAMCIQTSHEFGVKEVRSQRAPPPKAGRPHNTLITQDSEALLELKLLNLMGPKLQIHEVVEYNGKVYIFMPWMAGDSHTLASATLSASERRHLARSLAYQVVADLTVCHDAGYIHHDIKLPNVLWHGNGTMAVSDFGLARRIGVAHVGLPGGTPGMYAPEILDMAPYGAESDTWALGLCYFNFLMADKRCPLAWSGTTKIALQAAQKLNHDFFAWRRSVMAPSIDGGGKIDPGRIATQRDRFSTYFAEAMRRDAPMTKMFLQHVLTPASSRDASGALRSRMEREAILNPSVQQAAQAAAQSIADGHVDKRRIMGALQARIAQIKSAP